MAPDASATRQPWVSCFLTDILISHLDDTLPGRRALDYPDLFRAVEGLDVPADPEAFLRDAGNWVPLPLLRELHAQCEQRSGKKDFAYHAARAYFDPDRQQALSLLKIVFRVLNDVRSVLICASVWAGVHTNYLKLQAFESPGHPPHLCMLARFADNARPSLGSLHLLRGYAEGFPRLYASSGEVRCVEEFSQLRLEDLVREFPDYVAAPQDERLTIRHRLSGRPLVEAVKVPLRSEVIASTPEFSLDPTDAVVPPSPDGRIRVLGREGEERAGTPVDTVWAYRVVTPGVLTAQGLSHPLEAGQIFNGPYCRFRFEVAGSPSSAPPPSVEDVRRDVSRLLFEHLLRGARQVQMRMVQHSVEKRSLTLENLRLRQEIQREYGIAGIIGQSPKLRELFQMVRALAETDVVVLIQGETGTGKELIARAIHYASPRRAKPFVAVNCGALTETLLESELFGHEKGAFTGAASRRIGVFEAADGGTLFLDEIGEIAPSTQVRLLRVLQEGEFQRVGGSSPIRVNVRVLSATNQDVEALVQSGRFRQDLYYRLNVFPIRVPPLRERVEDIPLLVSHFIEACNRKMRKAVRGLTPEALGALAASDWPGNVRELENVIQRTMVTARGEVLDLADLPPSFRQAATTPHEKRAGLKGIARDTAEMAERQAILDALAETAGNITRAAKALGISRATLQNKMKLYGLRRPAP